MVADDRVKECVEVVKKVHHLDGLTVGWDCSEANNITEVDSDTVKVLRFYRGSQLQSLSHWPGAEGKHENNKSLRLCVCVFQVVHTVEYSKSLLPRIKSLQKSAHQRTISSGLKNEYFPSYILYWNTDYFFLISLTKHNIKWLYG